MRSDEVNPFILHAFGLSVFGYTGWMVRALVLIVVFVALLCGVAMSAEFRGLMALGGIAGACVALDRLTSR